MASKSARQRAILPLNPSAKPQVSIDADVLVKSFFEQFMAFAAKNHIGIMSHGDHTDIQERGPMASAVKERPTKTNGRPVRSRDGKMPEGTRFKAKFARGLIRWRNKKGLSIDQCVAKFGIDRSAWYRVEKAVSEGITASHIDEICEAIGMPDYEVLKLGEPE
jgi:hypothetical protein